MDSMCICPMWHMRGILGPGVAGAVFVVGWWFWVDAVVCSAVQVSFLHYLPGENPLSFFFLVLNPFELMLEAVSRNPGIFASLAALMFNCSEALALCGIAGAVGLLVQDALTDKGPSVWTGVAGVLQCVLVLIRYFFKLTQLVYIYALWISVDYSDL
uniref:Uncharacterized protein n=1 Tax=Oryza glumipatula TaxID=40148 RepID=A0A0E0AWG0_9ORYZ